MNLENDLNVFYVIDGNFIIHFTVSLTSLLENNKDLNISVFVVHDMDNIEPLNKVSDFFKNEYSIKINFKKIEGQLFDNITNNFFGSHYISKAAYYRLLLSDIIPTNILSGLYLDCDTIITGSLKELLLIDFEDKNQGLERFLYAVEDEKESVNITRFKNFKVYTQFYFNSGVLFLNLKKWRQEKISNELLKTAEKYEDHLEWLDQDILNIYFNVGCGKLHSKYNRFPFQKFAVLPIIIHFSGESKPWHYVNNNHYKPIYWKYLHLTPFRNIKFEKITIKKFKQKYSEKIKKYVGLKSV